MKTLQTKIMLLVLVVLGSLTLNGQVKSDFREGVDFESIDTYSFSGWENNSDEILNDFDKERILNALKGEFSARGMELAEGNADATITLFVVVEDKTSVSSYTNYISTMGYRGRWGWGMGPTMATTSYTENDYKEGTLVVDMYSEDSKELIWQGILQTQVNENPKKREKTIPKKIARLMKKYPVKASK